MLYRFIIFLAPFSIFSINICGLEFYILYAVFPLGLLLLVKRFRTHPAIMIDGPARLLLIFTVIILLNAIIKPFLAVDLVKIFVLIVVFYSVYDWIQHDHEMILRTLDWSIVVLVLYGIYQYLAVLFGCPDIANWLHKTVISNGDFRSFGLRNNMIRVASLTREPSYFTFIVGVYYFITKDKFIKFVCLVGLALSFSIITVYAIIGMLFYKGLRFVKVRFFYIGLLVVLAHLIVCSYFLNATSIFKETFEVRYAGLLYLLDQHNLLEWLIGSYKITANSSVFLTRPFSNIGSVLLLFGFIGLIVYLYFFDLLEKESLYPACVAAIFFFGFNYYYLTAWPIIIIYFALCSLKRKTLYEKD